MSQSCEGALILQELRMETRSLVCVYYRLKRNTTTPSMAHCLVQLNSFSISALSLAHHSPTPPSRPLASPPAPGTSQGAKPADQGRWMRAPSNQQIYAKRAGGRPPSPLFKSVRVCASMFLNRPVSSTLCTATECRLQKSPLTRGSI